MALARIQAMNRPRARRLKPYRNVTASGIDPPGAGEPTLVVAGHVMERESAPRTRNNIELMAPTGWRTRLPWS